MKNILSTYIVLLFCASASVAQTTAMDFTKKDCNGKAHHLFAELDSENVVIMEFFHTCPSCVAAANDMKPMYQNLAAKYGNKVRFYVAPGDDSYACSSVNLWITNNGFATMTVPFDSGSVQTAYYGGMGMPTIAVAAGSSHKLLYLANQNVSFATGDTATIDSAIRNFLDSAFAGVQNINTNVSVTIYPNPVADHCSIIIETKTSGILKLELTNISGQKIRELADEKIQAGIWNKDFPLSLPRGVYFIEGLFNEKPFQEKITILH